MKILIVYANPEPRSLTASVKDFIVKVHTRSPQNLSLSRPCWVTYI